MFCLLSIFTHTTQILYYQSSGTKTYQHFGTKFWYDKKPAPNQLALFSIQQKRVSFGLPNKNKALVMDHCM